MAERFFPPRFTALSSTGAVGAGYKLNFYVTGTTTPQDTYSDEGRTSANTNPVVADSAGRFGDIFLQPADYSVVFTDADDVTIWTADPVQGTANNKLDGTTAPGVADDIDQGFDVGSIWIDTTNDKAYICADSTNGAAVWIDISQTTDLNGAELILDADGDTSLRADTDDQIDFKVGGTDRGSWKNTGLEMSHPIAPQTSELTISSGAVAATLGRHTIDTEADASTDNLDSITTTSVSDGSLLMLYAENSARVVTVRDNQGAAGEIHLAGNASVELSTEFPLVLQRVGADWYQVAGPMAGPVVMLERGTVSAAASLDLSGTWSIFSEVRLRFYDFIPVTDNTILRMRTSSDGGSTYDSGVSDYSYVIQRSDDTATNDVLRQSGTTAIDLARDCGNDTGESVSGEITIRSPGSAVHTLIRAKTENRNSAGNTQMHDVGARRNNAADVDGIQLLFSSGNIDSGSYVLEGLR